MTVRKGPRLTHKSNKNTYYIELINTYYLLAEFSANPSQRYQPTIIDSNFKLKTDVRRQENMNNQIDINIINTRYNDAAIINAAIELAEYERSVMNKTKIHQIAQVGKAYSTANHKRNNSFTCEGKHVQFKNKPSIATYQQHDNTPMVTYDSGADRHYLGQNDRTKLGLQILRISDKKVGLANRGDCNGKYVTSLPLPQLSTKEEEADTFEEFPT